MALPPRHDFSQSEIGIDATVNGEPLYIMLDTGVDPSVVDLHRAEGLHLKIDRNPGGGKGTRSVCPKTVRAPSPNKITSKAIAIRVM
jgi:Aspartyl protease